MRKRQRHSISAWLTRIAFCLTFALNGVALVAMMSDGEVADMEAPTAPPHLLLVPGSADLIIPRTLTDNQAEKIHSLFPGTRDLARKTRVEEFRSDGGIPLPIPHIPEKHYTRYRFRRGWADIGLLGHGILVQPPAEGATLVVVYHRAYRIRRFPEGAASVEELDFADNSDEYRYALIRATQSVRIGAAPEPEIARKLMGIFLAFAILVVGLCFMIGQMVLRKMLPESTGRTVNLVVLLVLIYALMSALHSESVLAIGYYIAGRLTLPAIFTAIGLIYILGRWAYYPGVRADISIPFSEYAIGVARQAFLVSAPILVYLLVDSFLETDWVSIAFLGVFLAAMTLFSPFVLRWMFRARPLEGSVREQVAGFCRRKGVRIRSFYAYTPKYKFNPNAFVAGVLPFNRALFVSTHLLSLLSPQERNSVMAHELAHARYHHPFWLLSGMLVYLTVAGAIVSILPESWFDYGSAGVVMIGALLFFALSRAFEHQADRVAAAEFGEIYLQALKKLYSTAPEPEAPTFEYFLTHPSPRRRFEAIQQWISSAPFKSS